MSDVFVQPQDESGHCFLAVSDVRSHRFFRSSGVARRDGSSNRLVRTFDAALVNDWNVAARRKPVRVLIVG
jgi:hypothetical protein